MDHRGLRARLSGAGCTSCGAAVPEDRIDVLADRGDVAFVELTCPACGSRTLAAVVAGAGRPVLDTALHPELDPVADARLAGRPPLDEADVAAMRAHLAAWTGDLRGLLAHGSGRRVDGGA